MFKRISVLTAAIKAPTRLVTNGKPSTGVQKLIDFIKSEGKKYIKE